MGNPEKVKVGSRDFFLQPLQGFNPCANADGFEFNLSVANQIIKFIEGELRHSKGAMAGELFHLEPWERWYVGNLFGWLDKDGVRRFRKTLLYVPRKNGKSFLAAAIGLALLIADNEPGAEIYCAAADTEQAALVHSVAAEMVRQNEGLDEAIRIYPGYRSMKFEAMNAYWRVLSSEAGTKHGLNPHGAIIDEVHAHRSGELMEVLETGRGARKQPLFVYLTTADFSRDSACNRMVAYARKVRDGDIPDHRYLPLIYETFPDVDDWQDESVWAKVNPNLGISISLDYFREECLKAVHDPVYENTFKRLHLNMQTEQEQRWMQMHDWDASGQALDPAQLLGKPCYGGLDMSSVSDITAFVLFFPEQCACLCWFFVPQKTVDDRAEYMVWERDKYIEVATGKSIDQDHVRARINAIAKDYDISHIAYDPWNAAQLSKKLADEDGIEVVEFRQGFKSMNEPIKGLMKIIYDRELVHFGNPVLRWMVSNAESKEDDNGNIRLVKSKNPKLKIDGLVALVMAFGLSLAMGIKDKSFTESETFDDLLKEVYG